MKHETKFTSAGKVIAHLRTKSDGDPIDMLAQKMADMTDATMRRIKDTEETSADLIKAFEDQQQKMAAMQLGGGGAVHQKSWGDQFIEAKGEDLAELAGANSGSVKLDIKTLTTGPTSGGPIDVPMRDGVVNMPQQRLPLRGVLHVIGTDSGTIEYASQTTRTDGTAMVAEGAAKPESTYEWELKNEPTRVIAHRTKASNQIMSDAPQVRGLVDGELRYGLMLKEEQQVLFGTGTGSDIKGMCPNATAYDNTTVSGMATSTQIDDVGVAILQCTLARFMPSAIVVHPSDWWAMRLLKDADGKYILGNPQAVVAPSLFGLPVITTLSMTAGSFLTGDLRAGATLYDRWQPRVEVGFVNDDFTRNLVTIRAEERIAQAIKQPEALIFGAFS